MIVPVVRIAIAALAIGTVVADVLLTGRAEGFLDLGNHFGQFTVLSNVFVAAVLLANVIRRRRPPAWEPEVRGAAVVAVVVAGVLHAMLLGGLPAASGQTVNVLLHIVVPALAVLEWLTVPSHRQLRWWSPLVGLVFPTLYLGYTLLRGAVVGWYPYDFVDPSLPGGYGRLFSSLAIVLVAFLLVSAAVMGAGAVRQAVARRLARTRDRA